MMDAQAQCVPWSEQDTAHEKNVDSGLRDTRRMPSIVPYVSQSKRNMDLVTRQQFRSAFIHQIRTWSSWACRTIVKPQLRATLMVATSINVLQLSGRTRLMHVLQANQVPHAGAKG
jgi:hypothetical protein